MEFAVSPAPRHIYEARHVRSAAYSRSYQGSQSDWSHLPSTMLIWMQTTVSVDDLIDPHAPSARVCNLRPFAHVDDHTSFVALIRSMDLSLSTTLSHFTYTSFHPYHLAYPSLLINTASTPLRLCNEWPWRTTRTYQGCFKSRIQPLVAAHRLRRRDRLHSPDMVCKISCVLIQILAGSMHRVAQK